MTSQFRHIFLFTLIVVILFSVWRYYFYTEETIKDKPFTKGYSVEDIELRITNEQGHMSAKFISPNLIRYTDSPTVHINEPVFWTYSNNKEKWLITAKNAEYNATKDEVDLYGDLEAKTLDIKEVTSFTAKNLSINLKTQLANTKDGISLNKLNYIMTGQVAKFDLNNETLEVNNNVKAIYKAIQ